MPILDQDRYGAGPLYSFTSDDPNAFLKAGVSFYQTSEEPDTPAIDMSYQPTDGNVNETVNLVIAGSIFSKSVGVGSFDSINFCAISVLASGYVGAQNVHGSAFCISVQGSDQLYLGNAGQIEAQNGVAVATDGPGTIVNTGTITGDIIFGNSRAEITSTGSIIGNVYMSDVGDIFDTHSGTFVGAVLGGAGDDLYIINDPTTSVGEDFGSDGGYDTVISFASYQLTDYVERLELQGSATSGLGNREDNAIVGTLGSNDLAGLDGNDTLSGNGGNDVLRGGSGNDALDAGVGDSRLYGGEGNDILVVTDGDNRLIGGEGNDKLHDGTGNDVLLGGGGSDRLYAGAGNDDLAGNGGKDIYYFLDATTGGVGSWGHDTIEDFKPRIDKISFQYAASVHAFSDLTISSVGADTQISVNGNTILLRDVVPTQLKASDFTFSGHATPVHLLAHIGAEVDLHANGHMLIA